MTDKELIVLRYKAAAFDAFVEKYKSDSNYVGPRHIPIHAGAYAGMPQDTVISVVEHHVWELTIRIDSKNKNERPDMGQALFALIPPMTRKLLREMSE